MCLSASNCAPMAKGFHNSYVIALVLFVIMLQVICEKILTDSGQINSGLLSDPPSMLYAKLEYFLSKCIHPDRLLYYRNQTLVHSDLFLLRAMRKFLRHYSKSSM